MNTDDSQTGLFYYSTPEDMEKLAKQHGLTKLKNLGTEFMITKKL